MSLDCKLTDNLCLFACMFNSLRTPQHRLAFAANNSVQPTAKFVEIAMDGIHRAGKNFEDTKLKAGFNADDVGDYLQHLKSRKIIRSWDYYRMDDFHWNKMLIPSEKQWRSRTVIIHGFTLPSDQKKAMVTRIRKWRAELSNNQRVRKLMKKNPHHLEQRMIEKYNKDMPKKLLETFCKDEYEHGVAVSIDKDGAVWLYCNGLRNRHRIHVIDDIACHLLTFWHAYSFDFEI